MIRYTGILLALAVLLSGCASTGQIPESGTAFRLDGCSPFLNCVSSESDVGLYQVEPIALAEPLNEARWARIRETALSLPGAHLNEARYGYLDITCYSNVFHFPDYLEILVGPDQQQLAVRSQSMLGLYDFGVNRRRVETLRRQLVTQGLARPAPQ